jgi:hypothetical protein
MLISMWVRDLSAWELQVVLIVATQSLNTYIYGQHWGLNSGPHPYYAGAPST